MWGAREKCCTVQVLPRRRLAPLAFLVNMASNEEFATLCRRLKASDRDAFERVFNVLHDGLFRYVRSLTRSGEVARDITQDVFVRLWEAREQLDPNRSLEAYVYRVARNRVYNYKRNRRTRVNKRAHLHAVTSAQAQGPQLPDSKFNADVLAANLQTWTEELPERQREAFVLSRFEGLSHAEIASIMDISPRTVNNHIVSALKTLRTRIRAFEPSLLDR